MPCQPRTRWRSSPSNPAPRPRSLVCAKETSSSRSTSAPHAGCFTMALTAQLSRVGITPKRIHTGATVKLEKVGEGFSITKIELETEADIPGIDGATFQRHALDAKQN